MPTLKLEINAVHQGFELSATGHANEMKFKGVLVNLDTPSTKPPNGSRGKRIMIPSSTARKALHTLKNMGLNYTDKLDGHNPRRKVGVIKKAWIEGKDIHVEGIIWKKDFPEAEKDLKQKALGMSFEATDIQIEDENAPVWKITGMCFTGASILYKKDAAYHATEALAAAAARKLMDAASQITKIQGGTSMGHKEKVKVSAKKPSKKVSANATGGDIGEVLAGLTDAFKVFGTELKNMTASNHAMRSELHLLAAGVTAGSANEDESEEIEAAAESESIEAGGFPFKKKKKEDDSDDDDSESMEDDDESMSADADDAGDLEDMESDEPEEEDKPGHLNKDAKQKGKQTKVEDKVGDEVNEPILGSSAKAIKKLMKTVHALQASNEALQKSNKKLNRKLAEQQVQIKAAGERVDRRSVSPLVKNLLAKGGIDTDSLQASGTKLPVEEVDRILAASGVHMAPQDRIAFKSELARGGYMEEGIVSRTPVN